MKRCTIIGQRANLTRLLAMHFTSFIIIVIIIIIITVVVIVIIIIIVRGVNLGVLGGRDLPRFWAGGRRGVVDGFRKKYSVFCTESMLENVFFIRKIC